MPRENPAGKHINCPSSLSAKGCRLLQNVYSSARKRGFSKERSAQQAWGALRNAGYYQDTSGRWHAPRKSNPMTTRRNPVDETAADELILYLDNDSSLYRQRTVPIMENLARKMVKGTYDSKQAPKLWSYLVDDAAKKYAKEFGGTWNRIFDVPTRKYVANELAKRFEEQVEEGEWEELVLRVTPKGRRVHNRKKRNPMARNPRKMTKQQFEEYFRDEILPEVVRRYEQDGIPDRPARREAWNDVVDSMISDGALPSSAGNWIHPRWVETYRPRMRNRRRKSSKRRAKRRMNPGTEIVSRLRVR